MPLGGVGELYIGGVGLARGYLHRPDLTAARFIPDPFGTRPGRGSTAPATWCAGGPAARPRHGRPVEQRAGPCLEFLGRVDRQVKVRGVRIELEEIEAALAAHPAVRECTVIVREDVPGDKRLVAYLVAAEEGAPTDPDLRRFLQQRLPDALLPTTFVRLDALPRTPVGKLDQAALVSAPQRVGPGHADTYVAPRDLWELRLARLWEELLDVHPVGVTDNFFDLGGHSLLAVRLQLRVQEEFGPELPLAILFQESTIEALARRLRGPAPAAAWSPLVPIQVGGGEPPFCVHPVGGHVGCYAPLARHLGSDQPFYGLQAAGLEGDQEPGDEVEAMAARYLAAVRAVQPHGPYRLGGWSFGGLVAFAMAGNWPRWARIRPCSPCSTALRRCRGRTKPQMRRPCWPGWPRACKLPPDPPAAAAGGRAAAAGCRGAAALPGRDPGPG